MAGRVERVGVGLEVGAAFGLQGDREHLSCGDAAKLVEIEGRGVLRRGGIGVVDYPEHGVLLLAGATRRFEIDYSGGYATSMFGPLIHNIWL